MRPTFSRAHKTLTLLSSLHFLFLFNKGNFAPISNSPTPLHSPLLPWTLTPQSTSRLLAHFLFQSPACWWHAIFPHRVIPHKLARLVFWSHARFLLWLSTRCRHVPHLIYGPCLILFFFSLTNYLTPSFRFTDEGQIRDKVRNSSRRVGKPDPRRGPQIKLNHGVADEQIHGEVLSLTLNFHTRGDEKSSKTERRSRTASTTRRFC
jgi:hypothetical protein